MKIPGLYIHIPFCLSKCHYCDFYSVTSIPGIPEFLEALFKEMEMYRGKFSCFDTVYLGGGTPSVLDSQQLRALLTYVRQNFNLLPGSEITVEANPGDLSQPFLEALREMGINRLNIGVQSFDPEILIFLGRRHSAEEAISSIKTARGVGFGNVGLDLIYGVPGQDMASWLGTLNRALSFLPEHLSCYQLTIEEHTHLGRRHAKREFLLPGEDLQYEFFMKTSEVLEEKGYIHYEVSNFARGMALASRHNQKYWDHSPYLGLGPSAHSFQNNRRWWNPRSLDRYITAIKSGKPPVEEVELLTMEQLQLETLYLGLRTKRGIDLKDFTKQYRCDLLIEKGKRLTELKRGGLVSIENGYLFPTRTGLALADALALI